ncbi:hypothetical protein E4N62_02015 [Streptomyces sp. MNU76]|uniref:hypothetical protein n=1 Tax=Streptomyces sp. MNU76 TaxID=2560026 RepID=UPI001E5637B8|nr:hypothetical protein [Streptomyces sp. MNU76]MCC9704147.1 hypothetical protein [Streptomyces sp. MNU76]
MLCPHGVSRSPPSAPRSCSASPPRRPGGRRRTTRDRARSAAAPVPGADALLTQLKGLGDLGGVLKPVTDLLDAVLKADNGQLSAEQAASLGKAVQEAIDKAKAAAPATPPAALPVDPAAPPSR